MPDGDYGKLVCTVFRLVLTAAVNLSEVREGMLEATAEIPETIATIDFYREVYANLGRLQQRVSRFHVATLLALEHIVCWLMKKPLSTAGSRFPYRAVRLLIQRDRTQARFFGPSEARTPTWSRA